MQLGFSFYAGQERVTGHRQAGRLGITVETPCREFPNAVYRETFYTNHTEEVSPVLREIDDFSAEWPLPGLFPPRKGWCEGENSVCVTSFLGIQALEGDVYGCDNETSAREFQPRSRCMRPGDVLSFADTGRGRSAEGRLPFFRISTKEGGYIAALGWSGDWRAEIRCTETGVHFRAGMLNAEYCLLPGERVRTTSLLVMEYRGDAEKGYNQFRRLLKEHFSPAVPGTALPVAFESWGGLESGTMIRRLQALQEAGACFTHHWIDAGWHGDATAPCQSCYDSEWAMHTGDWRVNRHYHPDGLADVVRTGEQAGMGLMLWFEPERCIASVPAVREHPDWFLEWPDADTRDEKRSVLLNLGDSRALEWLAGRLGDQIEKLHITCYRQDFNCDPAPVWRQADGENRRGITEIRYINGLYRLWDMLHERFPDLLIDNCASGGRRIDLETVRRSFPFFRSDFQCGFNAHPDVTQSHGSGISHLLPTSGCTTKIKNDWYAARSAYAPSWGTGAWCTGFQTMDEEERKMLAAVTREYRRIQPYFSCDYYPLLTPEFDETAWTVWQYYEPESGSGIVMAFRRAKSPVSAVSVQLRGLEEAYVYRVENLNTGEEERVSGRDMARAFSICLPEKRSSVIFHYETDREAFSTK